ncbi:MarR family winged helix-turn-helix transcriptional regulator [Xanthobacter lutulentifluminis]|uniref:MarR family winged helix-turn-helix transcriptional regulator n=1 Tax=Xanthobacter lutulentifluminis TaxID=3119935 RepID=UPI0037359009
MADTAEALASAPDAPTRPARREAGGKGRGAAPSAPDAPVPSPSSAAETPPARRAPRRARAQPYVLDTQAGFMLRQVAQRHAAIFAARIGDELTMTQWAALSKLAETGPCSQNLLGRLTAMDAATIKGVVDRLVRRGLVETRPDPEDGRLVVVVPTEAGQAVIARATPNAFAITEETLAPLDAAERATLLALLARLR